MNHEQLVGRWRTAEGKAFAEEVVVRIIRGQALDDFDGFGLVGDRVDLRGFGFPAIERITRLSSEDVARTMNGALIDLRGVRWRGLDFSHGRLGALRFFSANIQDCIFDDAFCEDWRLWTSSISSSRFVRTNFRGAALGTWLGNRGNDWTGVVFDHADLRDTVLWGSQFTRCDFLACEFGHNEFRGCQFRDIRFTGRLNNFSFDFGHYDSDRWPEPGPIYNIDFRGARFENVEFRGCEFIGLVLPDDPDLIAVPRARHVALRQLELLEADASTEAQRVRSRAKRVAVGWLGENATEIFNRKDLVRSGGESTAQLAELTLRKAMTDE